MKKTLEYYMTLRYPIEITEIAEEEGGGISACIPMLGRYSCVADGESHQEALENLKEVKRDLLKDLLDRGVAIPEPQSSKESEFSGRILVRMPNGLHMRISEKAESRGESLNRFIVNALSADLQRSEIEDLRDLLLSITKYLEALKVQVSSYQGAITNTYAGSTDMISRGVVSNAIGFPIPLSPNISFEGHALSFSFDDVHESQDLVSRALWRLNNR